MFNLFFWLIVLNFINLFSEANLNILIVGGGGREHAITWKVAQSPLVKKIYVAPGNAGTALEPMAENIAITEIPDLVKFAKEKQIDLTIVGPETYLANGIVDEFHAAGLKCFGPTKAAAMLETSKAYAKEFMKRNNIPTAKFEIFTDSTEAKKYIETQQIPIVIKADGLCAGKGVVIAHCKEEAFQAIEDMLDNKIFGDAGSKIVIEEYLSGPELSFFVMMDGKTVLFMGAAQDHKRLLDGNCGPNTGGMGAYSPIPLLTPELYKEISCNIVNQVQNCASNNNNESCTFSGTLFVGVVVHHGDPHVLEFNCRFGDPETQVILPRLKTDLVELCLAVEEKRLHEKTIEWDERSAVSVVLASEGYPETPRIGDCIEGLNSNMHCTKIFHAATKLDKDYCLTNGGRVLCCTALGDTLQDARQKAYDLVSKLSWHGMQYRKDIAFVP